jgi:hypothetical protein
MEDLYKAQQYLEKYIEEQERKLRATKEECKVFDTSDPLRGPIDEGTSPGNGYVDQDRVGKGVAR